MGAGDVTTCGGCQGIGAHRRWCPAVVGMTAHAWAIRASLTDDLADEVGSNDPEMANQLYRLAAQMYDRALSTTLQRDPEDR